jgi:chitinase
MNRTNRRREEMPTMTRRLPIMIAALLAVVAAVALTGSSSASFVSSTSSTGAVTAAADWTPPTVTVAAPATALKGTVQLTATATDAVSDVADVTIQRAAAGGTTWTTVCTVNAAPFACDWNTASVADGGYDLRAVAVDKAGNTATSASVRATVANALTVVLARPGDILRGGVTATTTLSNTGTLTPTVNVQYAPSGTTTWNTLCTVTAAPYTCSVDSTLAANGSYDLRSVAVVGSTTYTSAVVANVLVDNLAPTVTMNDPGSALKGTVAITATAADQHSGLARVLIQTQAAGGAWTDLCVNTTAPYSCSLDTRKLANGTHGFRAVATDRAGNAMTSAVISRDVLNTVTSVALSEPKPYLRGNVPMTATVTSNARIDSVKMQRWDAATNAWKDICTAAVTGTGSPSVYSCTFATAGVADGKYDLRAVATSSDGVVTTSAVVTNRVIDNTGGKGLDIQTTNGGTAGRIDAGDTMVYTFSEQMDLSSIYAGWTGTATSGTLRIKGGFFTSDSAEINSPSNVRLGSVELNADFALWLIDSTADVSITASTVTIDGVARTVVTVRVLGTATNAQRSTTPATMTWNPSTSVLDLAGNATSSADVNESGPEDVDF